jgi:hypothetical protein
MKVIISKEDCYFMSQFYTKMDYLRTRGSYEEFYNAYSEYHDELRKLKEKYNINIHSTIYMIDFNSEYMDVEENTYGNI